MNRQAAATGGGGGSKIVPSDANMPEAQDDQHSIPSSEAYWPKKTTGYEPSSSMNKYRVEDTTDGNTGGYVGLADVAQSLQQRSLLRRIGFWFKCVTCILSLVWNVASPIKSYKLSFYGLPGDDLVFSHNLNWTMEVDYQYAKALYDKSGIRYTAAEDKPVRFINMYLDFVVFNRAGKWARYLDDFQQDPYVGRFCRTSLVPKGPKVLYEMYGYCTTNGYYAGNNLLEQSRCRVNEVSEAVMCLKGITALQLLNYEWKSSFDPNNTYVQQGAQLYQDAIYPNLTECLARRKWLVAQLGRDDALVQLTQELATNFSLDPIGFGGKKGLYEAYRFYQGFTDLSGKPAGVRYNQMSGSLPERTQPIESDTNALVLGRERLWWLEGLTPQQFRDSVVEGAFYAPYLFMGIQLNIKVDSGRFVDWYELEKADTLGICQNWNYASTTMNRSSYPEPVTLETQPTSSVLTEYGGLFCTRAIRDQNITDPAQMSLLYSRLTSQCLARDGCQELCATPSPASWLATFNRAGMCRSRQIAQSVLHRQGFVDWRCLGEGTGKDALTVVFAEPITRSDGTTMQNSTISNIANPAAVVACVLGGRIPQVGDEPYPNVFFDLIKNGPNTIITTTFSRGTEKVLVNVYALVSLVGCVVFSVWVLQATQKLVRLLQRVRAKRWCDSRAYTQLIDSAFTVNLSTVAHGRNIQLSKVILWLNLVTWYIGASDSNCTWWVNGVDLWTPGFQLQPSDSPYYRCKPGCYVDYLGSLIGLVRVLSISYNFYSLTCQHLILRGATRYALPFLTPILLLGIVPTLVAACVITGINHVRLHLGALSDLHNQLFLVLMWVAYLFTYHWLLQKEVVGRMLVGVLVRLHLCGKQYVKPGSTAEALIGPYYLTTPGLVREEASEWIPLSVALESPAFDVHRLNFTLRKYSFRHRSKENPMKPPTSIPPWVLDDDEFFFC